MSESKDHKVLYTARVRTQGNRDGGVSRSAEGNLELTHIPPGTPGKGTNPEQLLAAGWAACFQAAMAHVAREMNVTLPAGTAIDAEVDLRLGGDGYSLGARFAVSVPGVPRHVGQAIMDMAHQMCPYSKALRSGITLELKLV
ncbi:MAG TPA: Ohr family peroxiredoxin [Ramlibacter sp.]|jgi:Ohr subfamily peroxiredoxin|nr:Ohr family peroxiredoxin [Ramlibacter sp.]